MKNMLALLVLVALAACTDASGARRALEAQGYSNIEITGYRWAGCSNGDDEDYHTGFSAVTAHGVRISGVVCAGRLKGQTIRLD